MSAEHLIYIPQRIKILITALAIGIFSISITIVCYSLWTKVDVGIVSTSLTLAQTCAAGLSVIALIFYSRLSVSIPFLKDRTASYFTKELPAAMSMIEYSDVDFEKLSQDYLPKKMETKVDISVQYVVGAHYCQYKVKSYGRIQRIYVQLNVKRMVVSYFLDDVSRSVEDLQSDLGFVVRGAETAGYSYSYEFIGDGAERSKTLQLRLFRSLSDEFLMSSGERLYIANDFSSMTRALIRTLAPATGDILPPSVGAIEETAVPFVVAENIIN